MLKGPFRSANFSFFAGSVRSIIATVTPRLAHSALFPYIPQRQLSLSLSLSLLVSTGDVHFLRNRAAQIIWVMHPLRQHRLRMLDFLIGDLSQQMRNAI